MPELSGHVPLKLPEPVELNVTVPPVGVIDVGASVSVTVAVHVVGALTGTEDGLQFTVVEVVRWVAVRSKLSVPLLALPKWSVSPP